MIRKHLSFKKPRMTTTHTDLIIAIVIGCIMLLSGLGCIMIGANRLIESVRIRSATAIIDATIDNTSDDFNHANNYYRISYHFIPPNSSRTYSAHHLFPFPHDNNLVSVDAKTYGRATTVGNSVKIKYNPYNPTINLPVGATLSGDVSAGWLIAGLLFSYIGIALLTYRYNSSK